MAKIILGTIVTSIRGSIGGNTFRKTKTGFSLGLKSFGGSLAKRLVNPRLSRIGYILAYWRQLTPAQQTGWNELAAITLLPDKNGVLRYLTGRQLFIKLNIQIITQDFFITDSSTVTFDVPEITLSLPAIVLDIQSVFITLLATSYPCQFSVYAQKLQNQTDSVSIAKAKRFYTSGIVTDGEINIGAEFFSNFINVSAGNYFAIIIVPINTTGIKGVQISSVVQVTATT